MIDLIAEISKRLGIPVEDLMAAHEALIANLKPYTPPDKRVQWGTRGWVDPEIQS